MKSLMETYFEELAKIPEKENPFANEEMRSENRRFYNTYIKPYIKGSEDKVSMSFTKIIYRAQLTAFKVGFRTAVHMFMDKS